jgi:hypothetical protein
MVVVVLQTIPRPEKVEAGENKCLCFSLALLDQGKALLSWLHSISAMNFV